MTRRLTALFVVALGVASVGTAHADLPPIISRDVLFGNPERIEPKVSPDGRRLAWIAPDKSNVLQVWVKSIGQEDIQQGLDTAAKIGDDALQQRGGGDVNPAEFTHGTSAQRQAWFSRGYESGSPKDCDTFAAGAPN